MYTSESLCSFSTGRERADFLCNYQLLPSLGELTYYVNYWTNMAQMSLIKHESGSVSPISIFIVFPVHSQLTDSLVCGKKKSVAILRSLLYVELQPEKSMAAGLVGQGGGLPDGRGGRGQREESPGGFSLTPHPHPRPGCLGTYTPGKASCFPGDDILGLFTEAG